MKQTSIFLISFLMVLSAQAQQNISSESTRPAGISYAGTVTITVNGNKNLQVTVDRKDYNFNNSNVIGNKTTIDIKNLEMGQHTFQITRTDLRSNRHDRIYTTFNLRPRFNMLIKVNGNGSLELIETKKTGLFDNQHPMSDVDFNNLLRDVRNQRSTSRRYSTIKNAFGNTNNHFTSYQVVQLLQLVNSESFRLELAKLSYQTITDGNNFNHVSDLLSSQSSRNELEDYVDNYSDYSEYNENSNSYIAMSDSRFNTLYQNIRQQWQVNAQMTSLTNAFNNSNNHFTTQQASQLIQIVNTESNRLQLAKLSYRTIVDRSNFSMIYSLLNSQASKNELAAYVNTSYNTGSIPNIAMSDASFNTLFQTIQRQFFPFEQMNSLTEVFNNTSNYFTTAQAKQLIPLVSLESNRLQLGKLSYRTITDRNNFNQIYELLNSQSSRNELDSYVKAYND